MLISPVDEHMVAEIRDSALKCSERGLFDAARWASELLLSIERDNRNVSHPSSPKFFATSTPTRLKSPNQSLFIEGDSLVSTQVSAQLISQPTVKKVSFRHPAAPELATNSPESLLYEHQLESDSEDELSAALVFMEMNEYTRVEQLLKSNADSKKARFLLLYCRYLISDQDLVKQWRKLKYRRNQPQVSSPEPLELICKTLADETDPWLLYLRGLAFFRLSRRAEAIECALRSVAGFLWNWSAWTLLGYCIDDSNELDSLLNLLPIPSSHPLVHLFRIKTLNDISSATESEIALCERLLKPGHFPKSLWIMSMRAVALYHLHQFPDAEKQFDAMLAIEPDRIDDIDIYSNILYVTENRLKLAKLARNFVKLYKDRPEVACIIGNHYSMRADHKKAITYFRRATDLDPTYTSAWTLMGHEYIEMKNAHAAIEAYRKATDVNRKDYRAWHGIGQAYELLTMPQYALHYYQIATALRPYDVRLWQAQASCFAELGLLGEATECLKRALITTDPQEINIKLRLAALFKDLGNDLEAMAYHLRVVEVCQDEGRPIYDYAKSCLEVAEYHLHRQDGNLEMAYEYTEMVARSNAEDVVRAVDLLKRIKKEMHIRHPEHGSETSDVEGQEPEKIGLESDEMNTSKMVDPDAIALSPLAA